MNEMINELREENARLREEVKNLKQGMIIMEENCNSAKKRAEKAEAKRDEYAVLLGRFCRSKEGKDYLYENPIYESAADTLRKRDIEQQIKGGLLVRDTLAKNFQLKSINIILIHGTIEQLRKELGK